MNTNETVSQQPVVDMASRSPEKIAAQVAVEYVANYRDDFDDATRAAVLANGETHGVAELYLAMIR